MINVYKLIQAINNLEDVYVDNQEIDTIEFNDGEIRVQLDSLDNLHEINVDDVIVNEIEDCCPFNEIKKVYGGITFYTYADKSEWEKRKNEFLCIKPKLYLI